MDNAQALSKRLVGNPKGRPSGAANPSAQTILYRNLPSVVNFLDVTCNVCRLYGVTTLYGCLNARKAIYT